jgi:NAD(P)-dependent dehydrogenase (short-subunit alcohol dehydrogenase family)
MKLEGQIALVTAGASGLGRHIARAIAAQGAHVVIGDLDRDAGPSAVAEIEAQGGRATFRVTDVTDDEDLSGLMQTATRLGPLRALVNNAGGWSPGGVQYPEASPAEWSRVLDLNLRAPMLATQLCLGPMEDNGGGAVVNIASAAGLGPDAYASPEYGAAKAGLIRFTSCARGLATARGIRVSCVVPHWIGLTRARLEFQRMSPSEQARSGGLIDPAVVAGEVVRLIEDDESAGLVVAIRANRPPYLMDPAGIDPYWS